MSVKIKIPEGTATVTVAGIQCKLASQVILPQTLGLPVEVQEAPTVEIPVTFDVYDSGVGYTIQNDPVNGPTIIRSTNQVPES